MYKGLYKNRAQAEEELRMAPGSRGRTYVKALHDSVKTAVPLNSGNFCCEKNREKKTAYVIIVMTTNFHLHRIMLLMQKATQVVYQD